VILDWVELPKALPAVIFIQQDSFRNHSFGDHSFSNQQSKINND